MSDATAQRSERLETLEASLRGLLERFEGQAEEQQDFGQAWVDVQAAFLAWKTLRLRERTVPDEEVEREEECQRLYATLANVVARTREGLGAELDSVRQARTKLRAVAERRASAPSRAIDLHG